MNIIASILGSQAIEIFDYPNLSQVQFFLLLNAGQENHRHKLFLAVFVDGTFDVRFISAFTLTEMNGHPNVKILSLTDITFPVRQINDGVNDPVLIARIASPRGVAGGAVQVSVARKIRDKCIAAALCAYVRDKIREGGKESSLWSVGLTGK
jgi:hypothetical protein